MRQYTQIMKKTSRVFPCVHGKILGFFILLFCQCFYAQIYVSDQTNLYIADEQDFLVDTDSVSIIPEKTKMYIVSGASVILKNNIRYDIVKIEKNSDDKKKGQIAQAKLPLKKKTVRQAVSQKMWSSDLFASQYKKPDIEEFYSQSSAQMYALVLNTGHKLNLLSEKQSLFYFSGYFLFHNDSIYGSNTTEHSYLISASFFVRPPPSISFG